MYVLSGIIVEEVVLLSDRFDLIECALDRRFILAGHNELDP